MMDKAQGCFITIELQISFADLAEKLNLPVEEVRRLWNDETLADKINTRHLGPVELIRMAADYEPVEVGNGYV